MRIIHLFLAALVEGTALLIEPAFGQAPQDDPTNYCVKLFDTQMAERAFQLRLVERFAVLSEHQQPTCESSLTEESTGAAALRLSVRAMKNETPAEAQSRLELLRSMQPELPPVPGLSGAFYYVLTEKSGKTLFVWAVQGAQFVILKVCSPSLTGEQLKQSFSFARGVIDNV